MPESNFFKNLKVKASVSIINRTDLNHDPFYAAFDCPKINRESASAAPYVLNGELSVEHLFDMKMDIRDFFKGVAHALIVLSSRATTKTLGSMVAPSPGATRPATLFGCGFPSSDLFDKIKAVVPNTSMTTNVEAAHLSSPWGCNSNECCLFNGCAVTTDLCNTDSIHRERFEVPRSHFGVPFHLGFHESPEVTLSPTYNAVIFLAYIGMLVGLGKGLLTIKPSKSNVILTHTFLAYTILEALACKDFEQVKFTYGLFMKWQQNKTLNVVLIKLHDSNFSTNELQIVLVFNLWFAYTMHWSNSSDSHKHISKDIFLLFSERFLVLYRKLSKKRSGLPAPSLVKFELNQLVNNFFPTVSIKTSHANSLASVPSEICGATKTGNTVLVEQSISKANDTLGLLASSSKATTNEIASMGHSLKVANSKLDHLTAVLARTTADLTAVLERTTAQNTALCSEVKSLSTQVTRLTTQFEAQEMALSESNILQFDFSKGTGESKSSEEALVTSDTLIVPAISDSDPDTQPLRV